VARWYRATPDSSLLLNTFLSCYSCVLHPGSPGLHSEIQVAKAIKQPLGIGVVSGVGLTTAKSRVASVPPLLFDSEVKSEVANEAPL
jgi:hypothetical protein